MGGLEGRQDWGLADGGKLDRGTLGESWMKKKWKFGRRVSAVVTHTNSHVTGA